jgi:hypothetical protein
MYLLVLYMRASSEATSNITSILSENDKQAMNEALSIRLTTIMSMIDDVAACSVSARNARSMSPPAGLTECHTASGIEKRSHCVTDYSGVLRDARRGTSCRGDYLSVVMLQLGDQVF